jgi:hypothetical protein
MNTVIFIVGIVLLSLVFPLTLIFSIIQFFVDIEFGSKERVLAQGESALVKVLQVRQTGSSVNNNPVVHFLMEVHPSMGNAYRLERNLVVPILFLSRIQPGSLLAAKFDPNDRKQIAFDFERELAEEERALATRWESKNIEDLIPPAEQARRKKERINGAIISLIFAIVIFLIGLALVITTAANI